MFIHIPSNHTKKIASIHIHGTRHWSFVIKYLEKATTLEKVFYIAVVAVVLYVATCGTKTIENFEQSTRFITKKGPECLDDFYVSVYDDLLFNKIKNEYEISAIINRTGPTSHSRILDIGSGTGHHVGELNKRNLNVEGLDIVGYGQDGKIQLP